MHVSFWPAALIGVLKNNHPLNWVAGRMLEGASELWTSSDAKGDEMMNEEDEIEFEVQRRLAARAGYDGADLLIAAIAGLVGGICLVTFLILRMP